MQNIISHVINLDLYQKSSGDRLKSCKQEHVIPEGALEQDSSESRQPVWGLRRGLSGFSSLEVRLVREGTVVEK